MLSPVCNIWENVVFNFYYHPHLEVMMKGNIKNTSLLNAEVGETHLSKNQSCIIGEIIIMPKFSKLWINKYFANDDGYMEVNLKERNWFQSWKVKTGKFTRKRLGNWGVEVSPVHTTSECGKMESGRSEFESQFSYLMAG